MSTNSLFLMYVVLGIILLGSALLQVVTGFRFKFGLTEDELEEDSSFKIELLSRGITGVTFLGYASYKLIFDGGVIPENDVSTLFIIVMLYHFYIKCFEFYTSVRQGKFDKALFFKKFAGWLLFFGVFTVFIVSQLRVEEPVNLKPFMEPNTFLENLKPFVPETLTNEMTRHETQDSTDGSAFYHWAKLKTPNDTELICSLQVNMSNEGLSSFHYKDYGYVSTKLKPVNMSISSGEKMVKAFASTYIEKGHELEFINRPAYWSLYDPGKVESWVAVRGDREYLIMVDLVYGYVVYSGVAVRPNTYLIDLNQ